MNLPEVHFDAVVWHIASALKGLGVSDDDSAEVAAIANGSKADVMNR